MKKEAIVDRIEGKVAVLLTDDEEEIHIPAAWFDDMHEGWPSTWNSPKILKGKRNPWNPPKTFWQISRK